MPCGHKLPILRIPNRNLETTLLAGSLGNSFVYDWAVREKLGATALAWFFLQETPFPKALRRPRVAAFVARLNFIHLRFSAVWLSLIPPSSRTVPWRRLWAITPHERLRLRSILDAVVAELYGIDLDDFAWILRDCDHPVAKVCDKPFSRTLDPKGFWRVDKDKDPELRHPVLSLVAFHELKRIGLDAFLALQDGDGWMLPETLRLSDYGLGHDDRAREAQPVAARLGERFLPWQLEQGVEESWEECRQHAELIEKILGVNRTAAPEAPAPPVPPESTSGQQALVSTSGQALLFAPDAAQKNLFGEVDERAARRKRKRP
jgi:hypothetical protein